MYVGFIYNIATKKLLLEAPELTLNLTDTPETIRAVKEALEASGHTVIPLNADEHLPAFLTACEFDVVFNIATGFYGDSRQSCIPAMLEYLNIPHTGSGVLGETVTQHKPVMKNVLLAHNIPTPPFQTFHRGNEPLDPHLRFPVIVKLPAEGGSLGLDADSVVCSEADMRRRIEYLQLRYRQGALVEEFIDGREFTVSVLGNDPPYTLPIVERVYFGDIRIQLDEPEAETVERFKTFIRTDLTYAPVESESVTPAPLEEAQAEYIRQITIAAYQVLDCQDWARIDLRMDQEGHVYILDVNLEPAIAPEYALAKSASAAGWSYMDLVNRILEHAVQRYPHLQPGMTSEPVSLPAQRRLIYAAAGQAGPAACP